MDRGWPHNFERKIAIRSKTHRRKAALLKQNNKEEKEILPFVTQYKPLVSIIKEALMKKRNLIEPLNPQTYTQNCTPHHGTKGGWMEPLIGGSRPSDKGRGAVSQKFFSALRASF